MALFIGRLFVKYPRKYKAGFLTNRDVVLKYDSLEKENKKEYLPFLCVLDRLQHENLRGYLGVFGILVSSLNRQLSSGGRKVPPCLAFTHETCVHHESQTLKVSDAISKKREQTEIP